MDYDSFVQQVQAVTKVPTREAAEQLTRETFATLGERLYRTEQGDVGAQLPKELQAVMNSRAKPETTRGRTQRFGVQEFYNRVSARTDLGFQQAVRGARGVMAAFRQAVTPGTWDKLLAELPPEYRDLLDADPNNLGGPTIRMDGR